MISSITKVLKEDENDEDQSDDAKQSEVIEQSEE